MTAEGEWPKVDGDILYGTEVSRFSVGTFDYGDGSDGAKTISADTEETAILEANYTNLTIDSTKTWTLKSPSLIKVSGTLTINGDIVVNKSLTGGIKGSGGSCSGSGGNGGDAGGVVFIYAKTIIAGSGAGITASGTDGGDATAGVDGGTDNGNAGTDAGTSIFTGATQSNSNGLGGNNGRTSTTSITGAIATEKYFGIYSLMKPFLITLDTSSAGGGGGEGGSDSGGGCGAGSGGSGGGCGGAGGKGGNGSASANDSAGGGGGGGGSGGIVILLFSNITNPSNLTVTCDGGDGGNGSIGAIDGQGGAGGGASGGIIYLIGPTSTSINTSVALGSDGTGNSGDDGEIGVVITSIS